MRSIHVVSRTAIVGLLWALPVQADSSRSVVASRPSVAFAPNVGQVPPHVRYHAVGLGMAVYLSDGAAVFALEGANVDRTLSNAGLAAGGANAAALTMRFLGARAHPQPVADGDGAAVINVLTGSDPTRWRSEIPTHDRVIYKELWPGVDLVFRGDGATLKYDLLLAPGASLDAVRLSYEGADAVTLDGNGNLRLVTPAGTLIDERPVSYQIIDGRVAPVDVRRVLLGGDRAVATFGFAVLSDVDTTVPLVIDPGLEYSTYLGGGGGEFGSGVTIDDVGNIYVLGTTNSFDFPASAGAFDTNFNGGSRDVFVAKFWPDGQLVFATYIGGNNLDRPLTDVVLDGGGNIYLTGQTLSSNFPTTTGVWDRQYDGDSDCFVAKLSPDGAELLFSTYLGGSVHDSCFDVALDGQRHIYVTGSSNSSDFPTTVAAFDRVRNGVNDAFVTKLTPGADALVYSTYLGGSAPTNVEAGLAIEVGPSGEAHILGRTDSGDFPTTALAYDQTYNGNSDAFIVTLSAQGDQLLLSSYLGGTGVERGLKLIVDDVGHWYVAGETFSADFPTTPGAFDRSHNGDADAFLTKLDAGGGSLLYSTLLGSSGFDRAYGLAVDSSGSAWIAGWVRAADFPVTANAYDATYNDGGQDVFLATLTPSGDDLLYSTYLGGSGHDAAWSLALDGTGRAVLTGQTFSPDFPVTPGAFDVSFNGGEEAFLVIIRPEPVDSDPPLVLCESADSAWHADNVTVNCSASDAGSGLADAADASFSLTTHVPDGEEDPDASTDSRQICDNASNCATAQESGFMVDRKAPTIFVAAPSPGDVFTLGEILSADYTCADAGSGIASCLGPAGSGDPVDTATVGPRAFDVVGTDAVGNVAQISVAYSVAYGVCALYDAGQARKSGSTIPIRIQLCDAGGNNVSAAGVRVTATGVTKVSAVADGEVVDSGNANPDDNFRHVGDAYLFNLSLEGFTSGTWRLDFTAGEDPVTHGVHFQVK